MNVDRLDISKNNFQNQLICICNGATELSHFNTLKAEITSDVGTNREHKFNFHCREVFRNL
jgi:hypothetical protein